MILVAKVNGCKLSIRADFGLSSSTIEYKLNNDSWDATPFQVADVKHRSLEALKVVNRWLSGDCDAGCWTPGKTSGIKIKAKR